MKPTGARAVAVVSLAGLSMAFATSCAAPSSTTSETPPSVTSSLPLPTRHIAQLDFGRRAMFALCLPPACPSVTTKTLAIELPTARPAPRSAESSMSLDRGESRPVEAAPERVLEGA